ncbi:hypothetical protein QS306_13890 [Paraburkholderia bonniea]|uniref:hypothetical protein n=1 Tax=Paraburkholderia bonniea TaxID=2152891 RepID=UPI001FEBE3B2|nr:hypothetical protein [Paraburkholderia bonniea]WJF91865.1 hypothetical protein QS306_13890 [Paraburkholderia bonniea]WJF95184.1 hypothetical protein QS308_13900 [Paraburkholderia bonniea]
MFNAYSNDDVLNLQGDALTVSNSATQVEISGTLVLTRDQRSLKAALALKQALDSVVATLQAQAELPERRAAEREHERGESGHTSTPELVKNPFKR